MNSKGLINTRILRGVRLPSESMISYYTNDSIKGELLFTILDPSSTFWFEAIVTEGRFDLNR